MGPTGLASVRKATASGRTASRLGAGGAADDDDVTSDAPGRATRRSSRLTPMRGMSPAPEMSESMLTRSALRRKSHLPEVSVL